MRNLHRRAPAAVRILLPLALLPLWIILLTESLHRGHPQHALEWISNYPGQFAASYMMIVCLTGSLLPLFPRVVPAFVLTGAAAIVLASISRLKLNYRGEPLLPWDLQLGGEALDVASLLGGSAIAQAAAVALLAFALLLAAGRLLRFGRYRLWLRSVIALCCLVLGMSWYTGEMKARALFGLELITWNQQLHYDANGMLLAFALNAEHSGVAATQRYSETTMKEITDRIARIAATATSGTAKPNLVMVMSEAFWDPTVLPGVSFNRDPIPFFRSLTGQFPSGSLLVPVYGGGTANTEFEALTGFSARLLPGGVIAYSQHLRAPQHSLASILSADGYRATALHSYHGWFYRRDEVYRLLGFDRYISAEFFRNPQYRGGFIADRELFAMLAEQWTPNEPDFLFAVTMQVHGPYTEDKNEHNTILVTSQLSDSSRSILETYAQSLHEADEALRELIEFIEEQGEPTIVVFFGDHLPMLGEQYAVYRETGYFHSDADMEDYLNMHRVPLVIWDNLPDDTPRDAPESLNMSAFHLLPYALQKTGTSGNTLSDFLQGMYDNGLRELPRSDFYEMYGVNLEWVEDYIDLQYDRLFGKGYSHELPPAASSHFMLGEEQPSIVWTELLLDEEAGKEERIRLSGSGFPSGAEVRLHGKTVPSSWISGEEMIVPLPEGWHRWPTPSVLQVAVIDSLGRTIALSEPYSLDASTFGKAAVH